MTTTRPITIMIVDDHVVIRSGLRMLIEYDQRMQVVAQAGNKAEALERAASERPDVIILDLVLGDEDGLSFLPELCTSSRDPARRDGDRVEGARRGSASESDHESERR
jgi:DNA-binding NarL/FixJ family response regulator